MVFKSGDACVEQIMLREGHMVTSIANLVLFMVKIMLNLVSNQLAYLFKFFLAGPRLTVNCLTDHRTWYNLQVFFVLHKPSVKPIIYFFL